MMMQDMYFGTRTFATWVPAPTINMPRSKQGWVSESKYINGGAGVSRSRQGARRYEMDWPLKPGGVVDVIHAFAEGAYGDGPYYFIDPQAAEDNLAPAHFAHAWLGTQDGPNLAGRYAPRPVAVSGAPGGYLYPLGFAEYTLAGDEDVIETWFPVPDGYTLHLGSHESNATGTAGVYYHTNMSPTPVKLTPLGVNTPTRVNTAISSHGNGVSVYLGGLGTVQLNSLIAVVLPNGKTPEAGNWSTGKGNSGCEFVGLPTDTLYSAALDLQGTSAILQEVGAWV